MWRDFGLPVLVFILLSPKEWTNRRFGRIQDTWRLEVNPSPKWTEIDFLLRQLCRGNRVGSPRELTHKRAIMTLFGFKWNKRARQQGSKASALFRPSSQAVGVNISWPFPWFCWDLWQTFQKTVNGITTYQRLIHYSQRWEWGKVRPLFFILLHTVKWAYNVARSCCNPRRGTKKLPSP